MILSKSKHCILKKKENLDNWLTYVIRKQVNVLAKRIVPSLFLSISSASCVVGMQLKVDLLQQCPAAEVKVTAVGVCYCFIEHLLPSWLGAYLCNMLEFLHACVPVQRLLSILCFYMTHARWLPVCVAAVQWCCLKCTIRNDWPSPSLPFLQLTVCVISKPLAVQFAGFSSAMHSRSGSSSYRYMKQVILHGWQSSRLPQNLLLLSLVSTVTVFMAWSICSVLEFSYAWVPCQ